MNNYNPNVFEQYDRSAILNPNVYIFKKRMEESIQRFNPNYHFADFERASTPMYGRDIFSYYKNKILTQTPTTTITTTPTTTITTITTITPITPPEKIYLKYDNDTDIWEDITSIYQILYDESKKKIFADRDKSEHGWW